jgi:hypothetical protein
MSTIRKSTSEKESASGLPAEHPWPALELDGEGRILRVNIACETFFGIGADSLAGLPVNLPLKAGVHGACRVGVGEPIETEGEVEQASLCPNHAPEGAAWLLILVPPAPRTGETSLQRKFKVTLSMQVAMRLLDPIRLASRFAEMLEAPEDPKQADHLERLRKNLTAARAKVAVLREYLEIANRQYRFEILDFRKICDSTVEILRRKWPALKIMPSEAPPLLFLGNEYLFQLLLERLADFALAGEKPANMLLVQNIAPGPRNPRQTTLVIQCRGRGMATLPAAAAFRAFQSLDLDSAVTDPGLYLAGQIMGLHEGKMRYETSARGNGVSIFLSFPVLPLH